MIDMRIGLLPLMITEYVSEASRKNLDGLCHRPPQQSGAPCSLVDLRRPTLRVLIICDHFRGIAAAVANLLKHSAQRQRSRRFRSSAPWRQCRKCWQRFLRQHHGVQRWLSFEECRPIRTKLTLQIRLLSAQHGEPVSGTAALPHT